MDQQLTELIEQNEKQVVHYTPASINNISENEENNNNEIIKLSKGTQLEDLGRQKVLMAIHNLSEDKLMKSLDLGGFAMPSIAVTKDSIPHGNFGQISLGCKRDGKQPFAKQYWIELEEIND